MTRGFQVFYGQCCSAVFQVKITGRKLVDIFLQKKNYNVHVKVYVQTWLLLRYCFRGLLDP